ncbi:MAG: hypothetical protein HYY02_04340 [Chloroflexi bacterium]|nr:hypothetical protein [Chloroflexota bacterium]
MANRKAEGDDKASVAKLDPLLEEIAAATIGCLGLGAVIALLYWLFTGLSPWPMVILGEIAGLGFGIALLALSSPRRRS